MKIKVEPGALMSGPVIVSLIEGDASAFVISGTTS